MNTDNSDLLNLTGKDAQQAWKLAHGLDLQLEECQHSGLTAARTLATIIPWIMEQIAAKGMALRITANGEIWESVHSGEDKDLLDKFMDETPDGCIENGLICSVPLVMHEEAIGCLGASFETAPESPGAAILLEVAGQELDNVLFEFRRARFRHKQVVEIGHMLQENVLEASIDLAVGYISEQTHAEGIVVAYCQDNQEYPPKCARAYRDGKLILETHSSDETSLGALLSTGQDASPVDYLIAAGLDVKHIGEAPIETGLRTTRDHGVIIATGTEKSTSGAELELLQHFAVTLGQRLVDYHKDRRFLQQFFSGDVVSKLLSSPNYHDKHLSPRLREVAMLYTDITSFTKISEQILPGPKEVGELINYWSEGVVEILFKHGGVFDKMVGDCVIGIFGTPFDDFSPADCIAASLEAALEISDYTTNLTGIPEIETIRNSSLIEGLGVATGVNFGRAMVGTFGPNNDFTAFGREMNNTARLQGVAGFREVLVMTSAKQILFDEQHPLAAKLKWGNVEEASVKNVKDPLQYYAVSSS